jgi:hypothetical protein
MRPDKIRQECMSDQLFCFLAAIYFQQTSCQELLPGPRLTHRCSCYSLQIDTKLSQAWHENVFIVARRITHCIIHVAVLTWISLDNEARVPEITIPAVPSLTLVVQIHGYWCMASETIWRKARVTLL